MYIRGIHVLVVGTTAAALLLAMMSSGASAAPPVDIEHLGPVSDSFPDELCGIAGSSATRFVGNFKLYADGTFLSTGNFDQTFTSDATGKEALNSGVEHVTGPFNPTNNGNGTITETFTFKGQPMKVKIPNGPTFVRDAGNETEAITSCSTPTGVEVTSCRTRCSSSTAHTPNSTTTRSSAERAAAALDDDWPRVLEALRRGLADKDAGRAARTAVAYVQLVYGRQLHQARYE